MPLRLGLLSTARINGAVLGPAAGLEEVEVVAVASRSRERAEAYAREHGVPRAHGSYEALVADEGIDAVYVSAPNGLHVPWSRAALEAGKHVLCEKALSPRGAEVEACVTLAERSGLVLTEAFMWRHHPQVERLRGLLAAGAVGPVRHVHATFSFPLDRPDDPRWDPGLDGGALLDVGCYCVSGLRLVAGEPERVAAEQALAPSGVDARFLGLLRFPGGVTASFDCAFDLPRRSRLEVVGTEGTITLADPWHARRPGLVVQRGDEIERLEVDAADPYALQLADFAAAVREGRAPLLAGEELVAQARTLEALLADARAGSG